MTTAGDTQQTTSPAASTDQATVPHGPCEQRMQWFMNGYQNGSLVKCNPHATGG